jgi:Zinc carboxypeptidase
MKLENWARNLVVPPEVRCPSHAELLESLDDLARVHGPLICVDTAGRSRQERELICVRVGNGPSVIAISAGAHADEPAGIATCLVLIQNLLENRGFRDLLQRFTFLIHPMIDPDGAAINACWTLHDYDYRGYFLHNFRNNTPGEDCEQGLSVTQAQEDRPEMAFFRQNALAHRGQVVFYATLHTTHRSGGSLFLISEGAEDPNRMATLTEICAAFDMPVMDIDPLGEDGIEYVCPGFLRPPSMASIAQLYEDMPDVLAQLKMSTYEFFERECGCPFSMISELPSVVDARLRAGGLTSTSRKKLMLEELENNMGRLAMLKKDLEEIRNLGVSPSNPWYQIKCTSAEYGTAGLRAEEKELQKLDDTPAREYEVAEHEVEPIFAELARHKLWIKCLEDSTKHAAIQREHLRQFNEAYDRLASCLKLREIPLERQIRIQGAMCLSPAIDGLSR